MHPLHSHTTSSAQPEPGNQDRCRKRIRSSKDTLGEKRDLSLFLIIRGISARRNFQIIVGHPEVGVAFGEAENLVVRPVETGVKVE